ncbi:TPA: JAB domain-containing protein, partial [Escherichia coli]
SQRTDTIFTVKPWPILLDHYKPPSGEVTPSKADRLITERLVQALGLVDIRVPDHLIVGGNQVFSFAEHGLL